MTREIIVISVLIIVFAICLYDYIKDIRGYKK